ncbi:MAG: hypothetical protein R2712_03030 [Vicinamibacterales bacterium]
MSCSASASGSSPPTSARCACSESTQTAEITAGIVDGLKLVLGFIGVLTLAIGGIGVMNIMFVSVTERTREIGIPQGHGRRRQAILLQFLLRGWCNIRRRRRRRGALVARGHALRPWPFLSELLDDASRSADIHMGLSLDLLAVCSGIIMLVVGARQRVRARAPRLAHGSDRGAAVRVGLDPIRGRAGDITALALLR